MVAISRETEAMFSGRLELSSEIFEIVAKLVWILDHEFTDLESMMEY